MSGTSLRDFISRTMEHKRIRFGTYAGSSVTSCRRGSPREQAEVLIALVSCVDRQIGNGGAT
jgi:hypothetical protein